MTSPIIEYGTLLYGSHWKLPLSKELGVNERTIRRWASGESNPPEGVIDELRILAAKKSRSLTDLARGSKSSR